MSNEQFMYACACVLRRTSAMSLQCPDQQQGPTSGVHEEFGRVPKYLEQRNNKIGAANLYQS